MTTIVNIKNNKCDVYIGRPSPFGNPFDHRKLGITREDCVEKYREWFYRRLTDDTFYDKVQSLKGKVLGCWCVPDLCHGMVIIEYLEGIPYERKHNITSVDLSSLGVVS